MYFGAELETKPFARALTGAARRVSVTFYNRSLWSRLVKIGRASERYSIRRPRDRAQVGRGGFACAHRDAAGLVNQPVVYGGRQHRR